MNECGCRHSNKQALLWMNLLSTLLARYRKGYWEFPWKLLDFIAALKPWSKRIHMCWAFPCHPKLTKGLWFFVLVSLQSFDPNRLGKFKLDDYISMCIFLQSAKYSHLLPRAITCIVHIFFELQRKQSRDGFGWGTPHLTYLVWGYRNLFGAFDTSRIGHITLDFNQFVYCGMCLSYLVVSTVKLPACCV